jgi:hypothetical protein
MNETEYSINNLKEFEQFTIYIYMCGDCSKNDSQGELKGGFTFKPRGKYCGGLVHSDQMVIEIVRREAEPCEQKPKANQRGPSGSSPLMRWFL